MDPAAPDSYTLSLHDALPIWATRARIPDAAAARHRVHRAHGGRCAQAWLASIPRPGRDQLTGLRRAGGMRSEEHTSELQSLTNIVCRLLLEKKKLPSVRNAAE